MGEVFAGRYELIDLIGQGGMGSVWRVHDRRTDVVVAAKVLRQSDAASLLRFVRETAVRIQHPHIVTPLGWAGEDDRVLFTMPIVDGGSVGSLLKDHGPLPTPFVADVLRQLLHGLATVHASGIVHRDVKPANVLLAATGSERPHAYLTDFGIALELDGPRLTETDVAIGTPGYMAPEQRRGEVSTATDLYAVGVLARVMLTAAHPTKGEPSRRPDGVPDVLWDLTSDLLAEDPGHRPDAMTAFARLDHGDLVWRPGAAGDVEVRRQVGTDDVDADPVVPATAPVVKTRPEATGHLRVGPTVPARQETVPPTVARSRRTSHSWRWLAAGIVVAGCAALAALVIAWSPWSGEDPSPGTGGEVGTAVVGEECHFTAVGLEGRTADGDAVVCEQGEDGAYSWEAEDS